MDDLGDATPAEVDFFRCVLGPKHNVTAQDEQSFAQTIPTKSKMLVVSARFGCVFVALRSKISVYNLPSLREAESTSPRAHVTLSDSTSATAIQLVRSDEFLIVQVQESSGAAASKLLMLNVRHLIAGKLKQADFLPSGRGTFRSFTAYSSPATSGGSVSSSNQNAHLLAALTGERQIEVFDISRESGVMLWSGSTGILQSQAPVSAAFSRDGKMLVIGTMRGSIQVFESLTGKESSTIKEVESGWIPISLAFVANDSLLVCYQNESQGRLFHVVWHLHNYAATTCSVLGEVFYPPANLSDPESGECDVTMLCEPVTTWSVFPLGNSISSKIELVGRGDDGKWTLWELDEGKDAELPLPSDPDLESLPLGMAVDYTDTKQIESLVPNEPQRNPMPRLLVLTSDEVLLSFLLVDDRPGAKCDAVSDVVPDTTDCPSSPEPALTAMLSAATLSKPHDSDVRESPVSNPTTLVAAVAKETPIIGSETQSTDTSRAEPKDQKTIDGGFIQPTISAELAQTESEENFFAGGSFHPVTPSKDFLGAFSFQGVTMDDSEALPEATHQQRPDERITANGTLSDELTRAESGLQHFAAPQLSTSMAAAEDDDPVQQVASILLEMKEELHCASSIGKATSASVENVRQEIESNLSKAHMHLSSLLQTARQCFGNQSNTREKVNEILQEVIENGHNFEDLSLLSTLLTDQNDSRPLPRDIVEIDKSLSKKEAEIVNSLNRIEDKLEEPIDNTRTGGRKWNTHSEVTQHIYSSLSLQSIRIKRVKAMLNAFSKQIEDSSLSRNEQRVTNLGLSLSRLERLSLASHSQFRRAEASLTQNKEDLEVHSNFDARENNGVRHLEAKEAESSAVTGESASVLRRLAMRKGRAKICVSPLGPVSNVVSNLRTGLAPIGDPIVMASRTRVPIATVGKNNGTVVMAVQKTVRHAPLSVDNLAGSTATAPIPSQLGVSATNGFVIGSGTSLFDKNQSENINLQPAQNAIASSDSVNVQHANDPVPQNDRIWGRSKNSVYERNKPEEKLAQPSKVSLLSNPAPSSTARESSRGPTSAPFATIPLASVTDHGTQKEEKSSAGPSSSPQFASMPPLPNSDEGTQKLERSTDVPTSHPPVAHMPPVSDSDNGAQKEVTSANGPAPHPPFAPMPPLSDSGEGVQEVERSTDGPASLPPVAHMPPVSDSDDGAQKGETSADVPAPHPPFAPMPPLSDSESGFQKGETSTQGQESRPPRAPIPPVSDTDNETQKEERSADEPAPPPPFASMPPSSDTEPQREVEVSTRGESLFAALPPDSDAKSEAERKSNEASRGDALLAARPPAPDVEIENEDKSSVVALRNTEMSSMSTASGIPPKRGGTFPYRNGAMSDSDTSSDDGTSKEIHVQPSQPANFGDSGMPVFGSLSGADRGASGPSLGSGQLFGGSTSATLGSTQGSLFASPQNSAGWGAASSSPFAYSSPPQQGSLFGQSAAQQGSLFGQSAAQQGSLFGQSGADLFGKTLSFGTPSKQGNDASGASLFGRFGGGQGQLPAASSAVGGMQDVAASSAESVMSTPTAAFGTPSKFGLQSTFGAPSAIGASAPPVSFGSPFGGSQGQSAPLFGAQASTASGFAAIAQSGAGFGGSGFGGSNVQGFGGQSGGSPFNQVGFGSSTPVFGASMQSQSGFQGMQGSGFPSVAGAGFGQSDQQQPNSFKSAAFTQRRA